MPRPTCLLHPGSKIVRNGRYGKHKEFVRYRCRPTDGSPEHYLRHDQMAELRVKQVGGPHDGSCENCDREWFSDDGMPSADYDNFVIREKAKVLVRLAKGESYRRAAYDARLSLARQRKPGVRPWTISNDWRAADDWVAQYAVVLRDRLMPRRWPSTVALDSFDVRVPGWKADGTPMQKGIHAYEVMIAIGNTGGAGQIWAVGSSERADEKAWREFLHRLPGQPESVICDGSDAIKNAVASSWLRTEFFPCAWHLKQLVVRRLQHGHLWSRRRRIFKFVTDDLFIDPWAYVAFRRALAKYWINPQFTDRLAPLMKWLERNEDNIHQALFARWHYPRTLGRVEDRLDAVKNALGDRQRTFRNLERLDALLTLIALDLNRECDEALWARILRDNHRAYAGHPPKRRRVGGKRLLALGPMLP